MGNDKINCQLSIKNFCIFAKIKYIDELHDTFELSAGECGFCDRKVENKEF